MLHPKRTFTCCSSQFHCLVSKVLFGLKSRHLWSLEPRGARRVEHAVVGLLYSICEGHAWSGRSSCLMFKYLLNVEVRKDHGQFYLRLILYVDHFAGGLSCPCLYPFCLYLHKQYFHKQAHAHRFPPSYAPIIKNMHIIQSSWLSAC